MGFEDSIVVITVPVPGQCLLFTVFHLLIIHCS